MAVQKAEAQKRLMRPTKRVQAEVSEIERRRLLIEKKREDLVRNFKRYVLSCCAGYYRNNLVRTKHLFSDFIFFIIFVTCRKSSWPGYITAPNLKNLKIATAESSGEYFRQTTSSSETNI
jgi:hypothetical protein